jgi:hypothetical protein
MSNAQRRSQSEIEPAGTLCAAAGEERDRRISAEAHRAQRLCTQEESKRGA